MKAVLDTNIPVDYLRAIPQAKQEIERYEKTHISLITWIEILVGQRTRKRRGNCGHFCGGLHSSRLIRAMPSAR